LTKRYYSPDSIIASGTYYIKATNDDGCFVSKPVIIKIDPVPVFSVTIDPRPITKPATLDLTPLLFQQGATFLTGWMLPQRYRSQPGVS
jgi:hypothetical protein